MPVSPNPKIAHPPGVGHSCARWLLLALLLSLAPAGHAQYRSSSPFDRGERPATPTPPPEEAAPAGGAGVRFPWLSTGREHPISLKFRHEVVYDPAARRMQVVSAAWELGRLELNAFGGVIALEGEGVNPERRAADLQLDFDLAKVDVQSAMYRFNLPRAGDLEARITGQVEIEVVNGDWAEVHVNLWAEEGTARISRELLSTLLGFSLEPDLLAKFNETITHYFGNDRMLPLQGLTLEGDLSQQTLNLKLPLRNQAMEVLLEPRIERNLLWELWQFFKRQSGLGKIEDIHWLTGPQTLSNQPSGNPK